MLPWPVLLEGFVLLALENALLEIDLLHPFLHREQVKQEGALGLLKNLKRDGYALTCCSYPKSDLVLQLQEEDDVSDCCSCLLCWTDLPVSHRKSMNLHTAVCVVFPAKSRKQSCSNFMGGSKSCLIIVRGMQSEIGASVPRANQLSSRDIRLGRGHRIPHRFMVRVQ